MNEINTADFIAHIKFYKAEMENDGLIPTLEELLSRLEVVLESERITQHHD